MKPAWPRMLPKLTDENRAFWTGGAKGELLIARCSQCGRWVDPVPAVGECPACAGPLSRTPVSGNGTVYTFTVEHRQFNPDVPVDTVVAIVTLDEQEDLRVVTNVVGCASSEVRCGMPVRVLFEDHGEVWYPVFAPVDSAAS